jgi:hypothetical protein
VSERITDSWRVADSLRGLIGPDRLWVSGSIYHPQVYALIAGAVVPIIVFFVVRRWPKSWIRNFNLPVFLNGPLEVPPATGHNYASMFIVGFIFQFWVRRRSFAWWSKVRDHPEVQTRAHPFLVQLCACCRFGRRHCVGCHHDIHLHDHS